MGMGINGNAKRWSRTSLIQCSLQLLLRSSF